MPATATQAQKTETTAKPTSTKKAISPEQKKRLDAIDNAISTVEKQFGQGSLMSLGSNQIIPVETISTGSLTLDIATGIGGFPKGRIIEVYGPESSGKTTLALHVVANAQKGGGIAAYIDAEHAVDPKYARKIGVKIDELLVSQPDCGEDALAIAETLIRSNAVDVVVVDSVAALTPRAELEGEMGDKHVGLQARMMSQAMRKLTSAIARSKTCVIFINQIREKVGVMFGNPETTTGGRALKFFSSMRIEVRKAEMIKTSGEDATGNKVRSKVVKNKLAAPFRTAEFEISYNQGISRSSEILDLGVACKIIDKKGSWFSYKTDKIGQGREMSKQFLENNPDIFKEIEDRIITLINEKKK